MATSTVGRQVLRLARKRGLVKIIHNQFYFDIVRGQEIPQGNTGNYMRSKFPELYREVRESAA